MGPTLPSLPQATLAVTTAPPPPHASKGFIFSYAPPQFSHGEFPDVLQKPNMASSSSKERFVRSISESTATCRLYDNVVNEAFSKGLKECWKEELFFDVGLVTMEGEVIKCHKIVLASVSPFFKAAFSPLHQSHETETKTEIQLPNIPHDIMKMVIEFIYTGSVRNKL